MTERTLSLAPKVLAIILLASVSMTGLIFQGIQFPEAGTSGRLVPMVYATEIETQEKDVGDNVHFKVKVKNTGNVEATYLVCVEWKGDDSDDWESDGLADVRLGPGQYETLVVGSVMCTEAMMGQFFDAKFVLRDAESMNVLDEKVLDKAWYVSEYIVSGSIVNFWIE